MLGIRARLRVACGTGKYREVGLVGMTTGTCRPATLVSARIDPEVLLVVIEGRGAPGGCRVARRAIVAEICRHVIRIRRSLEIGLVALVAVGVGDLVVPVRMAVRAERGGVFAGQREMCRAVVERRGGPSARGVAGSARVTVVLCHMVRVRLRLEFRLVALVAVGVGDLIVPVCMAACALCGRVFPGQCKSRRAVVERRRSPGSCRVAWQACMTETPGDVVWRPSLCEVQRMAAVAVGRDLREFTIRVATRAQNGLMCASEREGSQVMVQACRPGRCSDGVTSAAIDGEALGGMVRARRGLEFIPVA